MSLQNKENKTKFISIRTDEQFRDLYKQKALEQNFKKNSDYFRFIVENFNNMRDCYEMLNSLFIELSVRADECISNFDVLREMITNNLDIDKLKQINGVLGIV